VQQSLSTTGVLVVGRRRKTRWFCALPYPP